MENRRNFLRMFGFVRPYAFTYTLGLFLYNAQGFMFAIVSGIFFGGVVDGVLSRDFSIVVDTVIFMITAIIILGLMLGLGTYQYIASLVRAEGDFKLRIFKSYMKSSIEGEMHSGEGIAAINTDADTASNAIGDAVSEFLRPAVTIVFSIVAVFIIDWRMGLGTLVVCLISYFSQSRFSGPLARVGKARLEANAEAVKSMSNIFAGALTIRAFSRQDRALIQFDKENGKLKKLAIKETFINTWRDTFTTLQGWLNLVLIFGFGSFLVVNFGFDFATLMIIFPIAAAIGSASSEVGAAFAGIMPPLEAAKRCFAIIDAGANSSQAEERLSWNGKYDISIENLNFKYNDAVENALNDVNLYIKENTMIAFVGASGSGKSTLLRTIIGMYERENLRLRLGDLPFTIGGIKDWRTHFAYVDQSCKLFDMTIEENIKMGGGTGTAQEAAKRAFAHDFISELADGYYTECGEKGASLSGGQKQRVAIARALHRNAPVLVFDEATSALDAESERAIMETIESLRGTHTILITTHNLHTIGTADLIVVMDEGRIVETGTHEELIKLGGKYWELIK